MNTRSYQCTLADTTRPKHDQLVLTHIVPLDRGNVEANLNFTGNASEGVQIIYYISIQGYSLARNVNSG